MLVSRMDYEEVSILECLLPGCKHMWCKVCQRTILDLAAAVEHLCDGLSDLQEMAQGEGWKSCPGKYNNIGLVVLADLFPRVPDAVRENGRKRSCAGASVQFYVTTSGMHILRFFIV
jgi:hypothetical protein